MNLTKEEKRDILESVFKIGDILVNPYNGELCELTQFISENRAKLMYLLSSVTFRTEDLSKYRKATKLELALL